MKFKFMNTTILSIVMCVSSAAHAGLILDGKEYMDLGLTASLTNAQIDANILADTALSGYELATDIDAAYLWGMVPGSLHADYGWHNINFSTASSTSQSIMRFFTTGYSYVYGTSLNLSDQHGTTVNYDTQYSGYLRYKDSLTGVDESGYFNIMENTGTVTGLYVRTSTIYDMNTTHISAGNRASLDDRYMHSLYVRSVDVPEPSTLAIFALGMIGLVSRRFKKQS